MLSRFCSVNECSRRVVAHGLCDAHYRRFRTHGDPEAGGPIKDQARKGEPQQYLENVVMAYQDDACLIWPFSRNSGGYAHIWQPLSKSMATVSRLVCERVNGFAPTARHEAAHYCGKGHLGCVAPTHLYWATKAENMADRIGHGTSNRGEKSGSAKLTESDVRKIRSLKGLLPKREVGRMFGVSGQNIAVIQSGKSWSWL